ncbi:MAG: HAMP domain-containing histidine kinase [Saprospiraceae bacterium]|nr:HAMP domain-containing histidine kinase [Saprospiraceae bacterium]
MIIGIFIMQGYYIIKNFDKEEREFQRSVGIALRNTANSIAKTNKAELPQRGVVIQESSNQYKVNVNSPIIQDSLYNLLQSEFEKQNLQLEYEYGIYDEATNELIYSQGSVNILDKKVTKKKPGKKVNRKSKISDLPCYFEVKFPEKQTYILFEMKTILISSVLVLIACGIFATAIFVILRQKRYSELMRDFVNNITHEFKTPISSIKLSADVLSHHPLVEEDSRLKQYTRIIVDQNSRLNNLVEQVLQIAKMESSSFAIKLEEVDVHELIKQLSSQYAFRLNDKGGNFVLELEAELHKIQADRFHLQNVFSNLLDNAVKYSKDFPDIKIRTSNSVSSLIIEIEDKGIGIKPEDQLKLFQKFYRVPTGNLHNVKGYGIGLYYVKRICDAHEFGLNLQSVFNEGTKVTIYCKNPNK